MTKIDSEDSPGWSIQPGSGGVLARRTTVFELPSN